jgi:6-phosphogluconolactonase
LSLVIHPSGKFAYTANVNSMSVSAYSLDTTTGGVVAPVSGSPFASGSFPFSIAIAAGGHFAYTANNEGDVSAYAIDASSGALAPVTGSPFKAGAGSFGISVDPSGRYAYVANNVSNDVSAFKIDATTGALAPLPGSPYAAGLNPTAAATDPSGTFLYVANGNAFGTPGGNTVSGFVIDAATGGLTPVAGSPFATATLSTALAVDPSGKFVYVANGDPPANNISAFAIDQSTGSLTQVPGSPFAAGANPQSITVSR